MPKRSRDGEAEIERWERKKKKYEEKLKRRKHRRRVIYSDDENDVQIGEHLDVPLVSERTRYDASLPYYDGDSLRNDDADDSFILPAESTAGSPNTSAELATSTDVPFVEDIDPELLKALGDFEAESVEWGQCLQEDIAKRFEQILRDGLKKEIRDELLKKYIFPKNVTHSKAPILNPEISAMLNDASRNRDKRLSTKQDQLGKALTVLGNGMTLLLRKNSNVPEILRYLNDAGRLLCDSQYAETDIRRSLIIPLVDKSLIEPFMGRKRDTFLFGDKLGELVKNSRGIKKTGQFIQASTSSSSPATNNLNWKGPSSRGRAQRTPNQPYASRGGGQRYQERRPAVPARRQPAARTSSSSPATNNLNWKGPSSRGRAQRTPNQPYASRGGGQRYQERRPAVPARRQPAAPPPTRRQAPLAAHARPPPRPPHPHPQT